MPLIALAVACYLAGLAAGFTATWVAALAAATMMTLAIALTGHLRLAPAFLALAGAGWWTARTPAARGCLTPAGSPIEGRLNIDASPGAFVLVSPPKCDAPVAAFIVAGSAPAGALVELRGRGSAKTGKTVLEDASIRILGPPSALARLRASIGTRIDRLFGEDAAMVRAIVIADKSDLSTAERDRFAAAGLAHVLAISGLHVAIIAGLAGLGLRFTRAPPAVRAIAEITTVVAYTVTIGAPASAVRAALVLTTRSATRLLQRPTSPWAVLAVGAAAPIAAPHTVLEPGYQLGLAAGAGVIAAAALIRTMKLRRRPRWRYVVVTGLVASTVIALATAPVAAWRFGRISLIGPVLSVAAAPVVAMLYPTLATALMLSRAPVASLFAGGAHVLIAALQLLAWIGSEVPGGSVVVSPTPATAIIAMVGVGAVLTACCTRWPGRSILAATSCGALLLWPPPLDHGSGLTELHMIDVGQGDAIALRTPHGHWVLFDAGPASFTEDAGKEIVVPYIKKLGGRVQAFILSHPHADHVGGAAAVIGAFHPGEYYDPGYAAPTSIYRASLVAAVKVHTGWERVHPGDSIAVDGVEISFLAPDSIWAHSLQDPNNASTIALVRAGNVHFLLVGDAEKAEETWLIAHDSAELHAEVLKVGHHGSSTSSSEPFLDAVQPRVALISVGAGNSYGHPSPSTIRALWHAGAEVLRTDHDGTVIVRTDGRSISVESRGMEWRLADRPP